MSASGFGATAAGRDRFSGEAAEPPVVMRCGYCGRPVRDGEEYYTHDDINICDMCVRRYAWALFMQTARRRSA
jgi:hypothetical protein